MCVYCFAVASPADYDGLPIIVTVDSCIKCVNITIKDDSILEVNETFSVILTFNDSQSTLELDKADISIIDNEGTDTLLKYCIFTQLVDST